MEKAKTTFQGIYGMMWEKPALMAKHINTETTALIVVDMINGFVREGIMKNEALEDLVEPIVDLMKFAKENNMPIICFGDCHEPNSPEFSSFPPHCLKGSSETELLDEIKAVGGYKFIEKNHINGFLADEFQDWLSENPQITDFIVTGTCTDICVMQFCMTLKAWFNKNLKQSRVIVPLNAVDTYDEGGHNITLTNTMAIYFMEQVGVEIVYEINLKNKIPFEYAQM